MTTLFSPVLVWIPDSNGSTVENDRPFPHESTSGDKRSHDIHSNRGKGEVVFSRNLFVKLVLPVARSGEGSDNKSETCIRLHK